MNRDGGGRAEGKQLMFCKREGYKFRATSLQLMTPLRLGVSFSF